VDRARLTSQNRDNIDALGVYVNEVVLRAMPAYKVYMPIIRRDPTATPTPTLTPTPQANYRYYFAFTNDSSTNNPDFNHWGDIGKRAAATAAPSIRTW